jgi:predicted transcriptional regulator
LSKKKLSDIVFHRVSPPDHKEDMTVEDLSKVLVRRLGLKRKESKADHAKLLLELMKYRRDNVPISIEKIAEILSVSQSQAYEEIRKWRTLGLIEFVKIPSGTDMIKGYMMPMNTTNRLLDRVESSIKSFMRKTRRIAKDFDDLLMLEKARTSKDQPAETEKTAEPELKPVSEKEPATETDTQDEESDSEVDETSEETSGETQVTQGDPKKGYGG